MKNRRAGTHNGHTLKHRLRHALRGNAPTTAELLTEELGKQLRGATELVLDSASKIAIMSDLHMGNGTFRDDLVPNGNLLIAVLGHYLEDGWTLVLNGDIEELQKFGIGEIRAAWPAVYRILDRFAAGGRLFKICGNHDIGLIALTDYPYPLHAALRLRYGERIINVFHGHQASKLFVSYNHVSGAVIRYIFKTFGIKNLNISRDSRRKFKIEKRIYKYSRDRRVISIIGHTHRPLFESLSKFDYLRYTIELLCREYPGAEPRRRTEIARTVSSYREELGRLKRRERTRPRSLGFYAHDALLPCLFNSGCAIGKKGINSLEIRNDRIALAYWYEEGKTRRYLSRDNRPVEELAGTQVRKLTLNDDSLAYVFARIDLLA